MIRSMKSVIGDKQAVSEVVGIILMVVVVVAAVAMLYGSMNRIGESKLHTIPAVSMTQTGDHILIVAVQHGPVEVDDTTISVVDSTGSSTGLNGTLLAAGANIAGGDIITISGVVSGETYTVRMIYTCYQVGVTKYLAT